MIVKIAHRDIKPHNQCFAELCMAFGVAGLVSTVSGDLERTLWFGANDRARMLPWLSGDIVYNAEAVWQHTDPRQLLSMDAPVWDYSAVNLPAWKSAGVSAIHCPIGFDTSMRRPVIHTAPEEKRFDVLFYGWVNERRAQVLRQLEAAGIRAFVLPHGTYGALRDSYIAYSKIVVNLHFYDHSIFEIVRCSHLFANEICVVSEDGGHDPDIEALARDCCALVPRASIVDTCKRLLANDDERRAQAKRGYESFAKTSLIDNIKRALDTARQTAA